MPRRKQKDLEPEREEEPEEELEELVEEEPAEPEKKPKRGRKKKTARSPRRKKFADGDIIAEGSVGEEIWDGKAVVTRRALGVVHIDEEIAGRRKGVDPEKTQGCEVQEIRPGVARLTELADDWMRDELARNGLMPIHLSVRGDQFLAWDQAEKVGSVEDMPD